MITDDKLFSNPIVESASLLAPKETWLTPARLNWLGGIVITLILVVSFLIWDCQANRFKVVYDKRTAIAILDKATGDIEPIKPELNNMTETKVIIIKKGGE
jgi:hypothetical protein